MSQNARAQQSGHDQFTESGSSLLNIIANAFSLISRYRAIWSNLVSDTCLVVFSIWLYTICVSQWLWKYKVYPMSKRPAEKQITSQNPEDKNNQDAPVTSLP